MRRVGVVVWIAVAACDRGAPPRPVPPPNATIPAARADAAVVEHPAKFAERVDAAVVDAEVPIDAMPLAPPKAAAAQKRDCAIAAKNINSSFGGEAQEQRDNEAALRKACVDAPWSATIVDCAVHAKAKPAAYDCTNNLPDDQREDLRKALKAVDCKYNDCIPDGMTPRAPPTPTGGSGGMIDLDQ